MATYAIGDIQGCFATFQRLLERIDFDPAWDRLWIAGDLVNRGPDSLSVLRWVAANQDHVVAVLGNHDLHLLGRALGVVPARRKDTLDEALAAHDIGPLTDWLRHRPLLHEEGGYVLVHAGVLPAWDRQTAVSLAREVEAELQGPEGPHLLGRLSERTPLRWRDELDDAARVEFALRVLSNLRCCDRKGQPLWGFAGPPDERPAGSEPWHHVKNRAWTNSTFVYGHWAAQGLSIREDMIALDSGCVWGNTLTAVRLEDRVVFQEPLIDDVGLTPRSR